MSHERIAFIVSVLVLGGAIGMSSVRILLDELQRRRRRRRRPTRPLVTTASLDQLIKSELVRPLLEADGDHVTFTRTRIETPTTALRKKA